MTSSSMPKQEHCRCPPETTVTIASDEPQPQMPGLGDQTAGRSDAVVTDDGAGVEEEEEEEELMGAEGPLGDLVLVGMPCGALLLAPTPLSSMKQYEAVNAPLPQAAAPPASMKRCVQCGATETPQWRMQPKGLGALCTACRIGHRPAEAAREPVHVHHVHLPPPATATATVISESPAADGWMDFDAYLLEGTPPSPRRENPSSTPTTTEPAPPAPEEKKEKRKRKPLLHPRNRNSSKKQCHHCKSASTPQWRTVVMDPASTPPPPPPPAQAHAGGGDELPMGKMDQLLLDAIDGSPETHVVYDNLLMGNPSSLDKFLFDGPAAPLLIDDDKDLVD